MAITYGDGGTNRTIVTAHYGDAGTTRNIQQIWYGDNGTNRLVFAAVSLIGLDPTDYKISPASASATYSLTTAGLETATGVGSNTWVSGIATSEFDVFAQLNSGAVSSGTTGAWMNLGTTRNWTVSRAVVGISSADLTISIRSATSGDVLATANVIITAQVDV